MPFPSARSKGCPLCGAAATPKHSPFCSQGCRDRDLLAWLGEDYRVPVRTADPFEDEAPDGLDRG